MEFVFYPLVAITSVASSIICYLLAVRRGGLGEVYGTIGLLCGPFSIPFAYFAKKTKRIPTPFEELRGKKGWLLFLYIDLTIVLLFDLIVIGFSVATIYYFVITPGYDVLLLRVELIALFSSLISLTCFFCIVKSRRKKQKFARFLIPTIYVIALVSGYLNFYLSPVEFDDVEMAVYRQYLNVLSARFAIWFPYSILSRRIKANYYL